MCEISYRKVSIFLILALIWQMPQTLAALLIIPFIKQGVTLWKNPKTGMTVFRVNTKYSACWSLGSFVFVKESSTEELLKHETGHSMQSLFLGPLYLLVVGIPSVILFWIRRWRNKSDLWYNLHFPENWANRLGGVQIATETKTNQTQTVTIP